MATMNQCLAKCLEDCKCLSFQICDNDTICQLCSSNREHYEESLRLGKGCTSFLFKREQPLQVVSKHLLIFLTEVISYFLPPPLRIAFCVLPQIRLYLEESFILNKITLKSANLMIAHIHDPGFCEGLLCTAYSIT